MKLLSLSYMSSPSDEDLTEKNNQDGCSASESFRTLTPHWSLPTALGGTGEAGIFCQGKFAALSDSPCLFCNQLSSIFTERELLRASITRGAQ